MLKRISCLSFCGIYKNGLSSEEKAKFRRQVKLEDSATLLNRQYLSEGNNHLIFGSRNTGIGTALEGGAALNDVFLMINSVDQSSRKENLDDRFIAEISGLNGSWAACLVDDAAGRVYLARDPAGAQSVYAGYLGDILLFTSSLTHLRDFGIDIDRDAIARLLHFLYIPAPQTIYQGIRALMPGESVVFDGSGRDYRELPNYSRDKDIPQIDSSLDVIDNYENLLAEAARNNASTSGKIGLFLSGGKDSSTLAIAAKLAHLSNIEAITLGFSDKSIDEGDDARSVAEHLGIPFRLLVFGEHEYADLWPSMVESLGQPMGDFAVLPVFAAINKLKNEFSVFWDGTGTDVAFGIPASFQEKLGWRINRYFPVVRSLPWNRLPKGYSYTLDKLSSIMRRKPEEQFVSWNGWAMEEISALTGERPDVSTSHLYQRYKGCISPSEHKTFTICNTWSPETCYRKVVETAYSQDCVVRYPFLDKGLIQYTRSLPESQKVQGYKNKILIRRVMAKHLPESILNKPKGSFNFQKEFILKTNGFELLNTYLSENAVKRHGLMDPKIVKQYVSEYTKGNKALEDRIWILLMLHTWMENRKN
jgi:asparagine synthase (glutamine-hydrolysing)